MSVQVKKESFVIVGYNQVKKLFQKFGLTGRAKNATMSLTAKFGRNQWFFAIKPVFFIFTKQPNLSEKQVQILNSSLISLIMVLRRILTCLLFKIRDHIALVLAPYCQFKNHS